LVRKKSFQGFVKNLFPIDFSRFVGIYSRKIVDWEVYENESSRQTADALRKTRLAEAMNPNVKVVLHLDNGGPMKGTAMQKLGVDTSLVTLV
jgi:transposase InsO family protein